MKTVICNNNSMARVTDANGNILPPSNVKAPEKGKPYRVTGEIHFAGYLYYFLMGFGIKTAFKSDNFEDVQAW